MTQDQYDAIVIGAGHNGLVAAAYLAKAGLKVIVLERRPILGGVASTEEAYSGFKFNTGSQDAGLFLTEILSDLGIQEGDLEFIQPPAVVHALQADSAGLTLWREPQRMIDEVARYSQRDAEVLPRFLRLVNRFSDILRDLLTLPPPALPRISFGEVLSWLPLALKTKRMGSADLRELLRVLPMPVKDFLDEWFENPLFKAAMGYSGVMGTFQVPRASGTAFQFLYQAMGAGPSGFRSVRFVRGGTGALSDALAASARKFGAEIRASCPVKAITLEDGVTSGVLLGNGDRLSSRIVLSNADPRHTFFDLLGPSNLPLRFVREIKNIKYRGSTARLNLALKGFPSFTTAVDDRDHLTGHVLVCPDLDALERAYDAAKYGVISLQPCLDFVIPTLSDDSLAPPGAHILSADVRYAPYRLQGSDWDAACDRMGDRVVSVISDYAPDLPQQILQRQVITPLDYEREYGLTEGSIFHGQMGLDQMLFMRPVAGSHGARSPVPGLYLCGAGAHPGGGVTGAPGYNAARQVFRREES